MSEALKNYVHSLCTDNASRQWGWGETELVSHGSSRIKFPAGSLFFISLFWGNYDSLPHLLGALHDNMN